MTVTMLREKRLNVLENARAARKKADEEKRLLTPEERQQLDGWLNEYSNLGVEIEQEERLARFELESASSTGTAVGRRDSKSGDGLETPESDDQAKRDKRSTEILNAFLTRRNIATNPEELRALQIDLDTAGGYITPGVQFVNQLIKAVDDMVFARQYATVVNVPNADSLGLPSLDNDPADSDWTNELSTGNEDTAMSFGKRELKPHPLAKRLKVSNTLLRKAALDPATLVRDRLAYKNAVTEEKGYLTGNGNLQPLGVFTASNDGVPTGRDIATGNTSSAMTLAGAVACKYNLKPAYWRRARWAMHRDIAVDLAGQVSTDGVFLWRESARAGEPARLLDMPVDLSEFAPNTKTTGQYCAILGDWAAGYIIAQSLSLQIQRLDELYAETNQTGFISRSEVDGMPVLAEAFSRSKLG